MIPPESYGDPIDPNLIRRLRQEFDPDDVAELREASIMWNFSNLIMQECRRTFDAGLQVRRLTIKYREVSVAYELYPGDSEMEDEKWKKLADLRSRISSELWSSIYSFLSGSAAISKIFWSPREDRSPHKERCVLLRSKFSLSDASPLKNRAIRDAYEHLDERLSRWLEHDVQNFVPNVITGKPMLPVHRFKDPLIMSTSTAESMSEVIQTLRRFDSETFTVYFHDLGVKGGKDVSIDIMNTAREIGRIWNIAKGVCDEYIFVAGY